jgi:hypothetical protein
LSKLPFDGHRHNGHEAECRQLLAVHGLRHHLERGAVATGSVWCASMAVRRARVVRQGLERIAPMIAPGSQVVVAHAQWPNYPSPGLRRTID